MAERMTLHIWSDNRCLPLSNSRSQPQCGLPQIRLPFSSRSILVQTQCSCLQAVDRPRSRSPLISWSQSVALALALSASTVLYPPQAQAIPGTNEIPEAGAEVVAGTESVLEQQREAINRENDKNDKVRPPRLARPDQRPARLTLSRHRSVLTERLLLQTGVPGSEGGQRSEGPSDSGSIP